MILLGVAAALMLVQTALVLGFLVPGGKASVLAGVLAGAGHLNPVLTYLALAASAILGASIGYLLGRRHGEALLEHRLLARHADRVAQARGLVHRRAGFSLLAGRSLAIFRATTPALAGAVGVDPRRFMIFNVVGGLLWAAVFVGSGFLGGRFLPELSLNPSTATIAAVLGIAVLVWMFAYRGRAAQASD